ncbi:MAG: indole-3-glycerol-phosphate synthase [Proteobacteria bacterium]|nr:indole-3-glycerol-phosphate synthase [Pseudomonadota bacterium]MBU1611984.1 indole-3-glycerol-phosphate synthase [Pseudomonadota bacterium]
MLDRFRAAKQGEISFLHKEFGEGRIPARWDGVRPPFAARLRSDGPGAVIAEFKRASPSLGDINLDLAPEEAADIFAGEGASAMSVLTEETYFKGTLDYLVLCQGYGLPLLRKDFLFDPLQVALTAASPASAFLLIVRMFETAQDLAVMIEIGKAAGLEAVVEIFDERDLELAREAGATIIQVNSRDLDTLAMDDANQKRLIADRKKHEVWIAASGIKGPKQVREMAALGYEAVLVGTSIMQAENIGGALRALTEARK